MLTINACNADRIWSWLKTRDGVAVWNSISLSDPGKQMLSPVKSADGTPSTKPHWSLSNTPEVITKPEDIVVSEDREVKRFHVGTRMGSQGMSIKVTDAGTERIRREVEKAGEGAYYTFDYEDYKNAVIMAPSGGAVSLIDYARQHNLT
jgi:hypothetical protein